eukprot:jgi/Undpi1/11628/HiC_scaffold_35.g13923.m1
MSDSAAETLWRKPQNMFWDPLQQSFSSGNGVGAANGDGGALGKMQAYISMTEERFRLALHTPLFVWVYGYNSREQLRDDLGTNLKKHVNLASVDSGFSSGSVVDADE